MEVLSSRTIIATEDFDRSRAFYEETLGLSVYREYGSAGAVTGVVLFLGGGFLEITQGSAHSRETPSRCGSRWPTWPPRSVGCARPVSR